MVAISNTSSKVNDAAEIARKPATETGRQGAGVASPVTPPPSPAVSRDQFIAQPAPAYDPATPAPASILLSEDIHDGQANCLDRAGDWLELASPEIRARSEVLFLRDTRPGAEGLTGHVVIRQGQGIYDPMTNRSYPDFQTFNAQGNYQIAGTVGGAAMQRILSTEPGSAARQEAIARAGVSQQLATMLVADGPDVRVTTEDGVRLRGGPVDGEIFTEMPRGTRLTVLESQTGSDGKEWLHVSAEIPGMEGPQDGWVSAQYTQAAGGPVTVSENGLPSMDSIASRTPRYRQGDTAWGANPLYNDQVAKEDGSYENTIRTRGCAVTSAAMAMSNTLLAYGYPAVTPQDVDTHLDGVGGYTDQSALRWSYERTAGAVPLDHHSAHYSQQGIDDALAQGSAVVLEVRVDKTDTDPGWMHYVCIVGKSVDTAGNVTYQAYDPAYNDGTGNAALVTFTLQPDGTLHATNGGSGTYDTTADTGIHWYTPTADMVAAATAQQ